MENEVCNKFACEYEGNDRCVMSIEHCSSDCDFFNKCTFCCNNSKCVKGCVKYEIYC